MKAIVVILAFILASGTGCAGQEKDSLLVMFWNMENFFDYRDGGEGDSDREFSSMGSRHWTKSRFQAKCNAVSKSIYYLSDIYGKIPDMIGLAEIENSNVLYRLLEDTSLRKTDYASIHYDGRDRRGIDVAILYRKSVMTPLSIDRKIPIYDGDTLDTRDILHVRMALNGLENPRCLDMIVNHHPSKYGGEKASEGRRAAAMSCLKELVDSLSSTDKVSDGIIAMGDFNDTPDSYSFSIINNTLDNKASDLYGKGRGTIRFEGRWELIDMFLTSPGLTGRTEMEIVEIPFLMVRDTKHSGYKPFRTYSGPRYIGGVSDHCPIILRVYWPNMDVF